MKLVNLCRRAGVQEERLQEFTDTIRELIGADWSAGPWVAGGCVRRLLSGEDPFASDIDVFFASESQRDSLINTLKYKYPNCKVTQNAFNTTLQLNDKFKVQAVHLSYFDSPHAVIDTFDYTICQFITDGNEITVGEFSLWDLARKRLVIHNLRHPIASMRRLLKYGTQGFYACSGTMSDFIARVRAMDNALLDEQVFYID